MGFLRRILNRIAFIAIASVLVPLAVLLVWLYMYGLPDQLKTVLLSNLEQRGAMVDVDRVRIDSLGRVVAENVTVFRSQDRQESWVKLDRARVGVAWLSWWRGHSFVNYASVTNADISLPLGPDASIPLQAVNAHVEVDKDGMEIVDAGARLLNFELKLNGRIAFGNRPPPVNRPTPTPQQQDNRDKLWETFRKYAAEITSPDPIQIQVHFDIPMANPERTTARFSLATWSAMWRGVPVDEFYVQGDLRDGLLRITDFRVRLKRGQFSMQGEWQTAQRNARVVFNSNMDFTPLAAVLPPSARPAASKLKFARLPIITGQVKVDWAEKFAMDVQADLDWQRFSYADVPFERFCIMLAYDGRRLLIPDAHIINHTGELKLDFFLNGDKRLDGPLTPAAAAGPAVPEIRGRLRNTLDITSLKGLLGEGFDRFLASLDFPKRAPIVTATVEGNTMKPDDWLVTGRLDAGAFAYKKVHINEATGDFTFRQMKLTMPALSVKRNEGTAVGGLIYDFRNKWCQINNIASTLSPYEVAPFFGDKFIEYIRPYRFDRIPALRVNGMIDLDEYNRAESISDWVMEITSRGNMEWELFRIPFVFNQPRGRLHFLKRTLKVTIDNSGMFGGKLAGTLDLNLKQNPALYNLRLGLTTVDWARLMRTCFHYEKNSGTMTGALELGGVMGKLDTMKGRGNLVITNGFLTNIPVLGGLSALLSSIVPDFGYAKATRAESSFNITRGVLYTTDLDMHGEGFALIGEGSYSFVKDYLDLNMRVNVRGPIGTLMYVVSKLFEYRGTGPMKNPKWVPLNF
ncbi:MAG: AsmA-like C-terminal region-containing protein [Candidatus Methylacidiphilales bacterium]|nr:AsmA-like C-terminal region-containing protein [Candidatus Methylacidiphilales bacterium]